MNNSGSRRVTAVASLFAGVFALSFTAAAHHSFSMFDNEKEETVTGTVKEFQWTNPHVWVQLSVTNDSGKEIEWSLEGNSPNVLARMGWSRNSLKPGDKAVIIIHPLKSGSQGGSLVRVTINGQRIGAALPVAGAGP